MLNVNYLKSISESIISCDEETKLKKKKKRKQKTVWWRKKWEHGPRCGRFSVPLAAPVLKARLPGVRSVLPQSSTRKRRRDALWRRAPCYFLFTSFQYRRHATLCVQRLTITLSFLTVTDTHIHTIYNHKWSRKSTHLIMHGNRRVILIFCTMMNCAVSWRVTFLGRDTSVRVSFEF